MSEKKPITIKDAAEELSKMFDDFPINEQIQTNDRSMHKNWKVSEQPTLRDQFAMAALQGMLANRGSGPDPEWHSQHAYRQADAMLKARHTKEIDCE